MWPNYGENMRVLKWMIDRIEGKASGHPHAFGISPAYEEVNWEGLAFTPEQFQQVIATDRQASESELQLHQELFQKLEYHLPAQLKQTKDQIQQRLAA